MYNSYKYYWIVLFLIIGLKCQLFFYYSMCLLCKSEFNLDIENNPPCTFLKVKLIQDTWTIDCLRPKSSKYGKPEFTTLRLEMQM